MQLRNVAKFAALVALAVVLSFTTMIFGAIPMRVVRRSFGRTAFWVAFVAIATALAAAQLASYAVIVFAQAVLVGIYSEVEEPGGSAFVAGTLALLGSVGTVAVTVGLWLQSVRANLIVTLRTQLEPMVAKMQSVNPQAGLDVDSILRLLPSGALIALLGSLAFALVWERPLAKGFALTMPPKEPLTRFRVPDLLVWVVMVAILGSFLQHGLGWLTIASTNLLYVLAVVYFLQGLAVMAVALRVFGIGPFWRGVWYFLMLFQLSLLVSLIGFVDYWVEFRERLSRKPAEPNKSV